MVLVTAPTHACRCLREAMVVFGAQSSLNVLAGNLRVAPSHVSYDGSSPDDVFVFEPPHRPDRQPEHDARYEVVSRIARSNLSLDSDFLAALMKTIELQEETR